MKRALMAAALLSLACVTQRRAGTESSSGAPQIDAIRPESVFVASGAVVEVVLEGHGFVPGTPGRNTVLFDALTLNDVPADEDGRRIRLVLPEMVPSGSEAPPRPLADGAHVVRVRTASGESNPATVRVFR